MRQLDIDVCQRLRRKRDLGFDDRFAYGLDTFRLLPKIDTLIAGNVVERNRDQEVVNVIAAQMGITVGGDDFKNAFMQPENGDVEGAAAEIINCDDAFFLAIEAIGQGGGRGLIDQSQNFQARHASRILRCLPLGVVKVRGHRDHCLGDRGSEIPLRVALKLAQDVGRYFGRGELRIAETYAQYFARLDFFDQAEREKL